MKIKHILCALLISYYPICSSAIPTAALETDRLFLRQVQITDAHEIAKIALNQEVRKKTGLFPQLTSLDDVVNFVQIYLVGNENLSKAPRYPNTWVMVEKISGNILGLVLFVAYLERHQRAEIAYAVVPDYWNNGYATEACQAVIRFAFSQGVFRIYATVDPENGASERVLQKAHMSFEGLLHAYMIVNGLHVDRKMYAIIANT